MVLPRQYRTVVSVLPNVTQDEANLLTKECMKSYFTDWNLIHFKYSAYSGSYLDLPRCVYYYQIKLYILE